MMVSSFSRHRRRSMAFLVVVLAFAVLSLASLAASQRDSGSSWASDASSSSSSRSSSNGVAVTSFVKHGGASTGRKASSDGDNDEGGDIAAGDASVAKTIAQRIDEALEQEFPEDKKKDSIGKAYTEKAKQEDVSLRVGKRETRRERWRAGRQHPDRFKKKKLNLFLLPLSPSPNPRTKN